MNAQAEDEYKAAIKVNQYDELSWRQLGGIMTAKGDFKAAEEDYKKALALQPKDSDAKTGLAIVLISMNRTDEAISLLESAINDDPTNIVAHYRLSGLYRRAGRTADAQRETETFHHYQDVKDKLGKVFKQLAGPTSQMCDGRHHRPVALAGLSLAAAVLGAHACRPSVRRSTSRTGGYHCFHEDSLQASRLAG